MSTVRVLHVPLEEYQRRMNVFHEAERTLALEGIATPDDMREIAERFAYGEIDFGTYSALCREAIRKRGTRAQ